MENLLSALGDFFSSIFSRKSRGSVIGIDPGSSAIKVVQLRKRKGVAVLETYGELSLGPYAGLEIGQATNLQAEKISEALKDVMREANVTTQDAGISIPFSSSLISLIELPDVPQKQLAKMISIEARKYIPVPISEVALDWFVIPEEEARFLSLEKTRKGQVEKKAARIHVLLVAIHNEVLSKYQDVSTQTNLATSFFEIEIFSVARAVLDQGIAPVLILDMGAATTKLYIVEYGIVRASHVINKGAQDITLALSRSLGVSISKAERMKREFGIQGSADKQTITETSTLTLDYIFSEVNRVLRMYQQRNNKNIEKVILTGGGAVLKGLLSFAGKHLEVPISLADPFSKLETPAFLEAVLKDTGSEFSVATGLALRKLQEQ